VIYFKSGNYTCDDGIPMVSHHMTSFSFFCNTIGLEFFGYRLSKIYLCTTNVPMNEVYIFSIKLNYVKFDQIFRIPDKCM
jgi:hypothetical protein